MTQLVRQTGPTPGPFGLPARLAQDVHDPSEEAFSLRKYLEVLRRRKGLIAAVMALVLALTAIQVVTITPLFKATATLQVDPDTGRILPYDNIGRTTRRGNDEDYLNTELRKLSSAELARQVVERLDLGSNERFAAPISEGLVLEVPVRALATVKRLLKGALPRSRDGLSPRQVVSRVQRYVSTSKVRNTRLIQVSFLSPDREVSAAVANAFAELFIERNMENSFEAVSRATEYLQEQLADLRTQFERSEQALLDYARSKNIVNVSERETASRKKLGDLVEALAELEEERTAQAARYDAIRRSTVDNLPASLKDEGLQALEQRLSSLRARQAALLAEYGRRWPAVRELELEIADTERQLQVEMGHAAERAREELELTNSRYYRLRAEVEEQRQLVEKREEDSFQYDLLKREAETTKELYESVLTRLKQAGVAAGMRSANVRITEPAAVPGSQSSPDKTKSMLLALAFGLVLGVGLAFLAEMVDNSLKSTEDVTRYLKLPALGLIPSLYENGRVRGWKPWRRPRPRDPLPVLVDSDADRTRARAREAYRALRTSILLSNSEKPPQTVLVTSALPGEGKSTTAVNTAIALAQTGNRTLLIDMDLRKPKLSQLLGQPVGIGLSGFLSGNSDLASRIRETSTPNLFLVGAGPTPPNPPELLGSKRMATGFNLLKEYFTHIVIDSPPAMELSDALVVSPHTDGVILVARGGKTPRAAVARTAFLLQNVGAKVLGVLINDIDSARSADGYYYRYGRYDSYYTTPSASS